MTELADSLAHWLLDRVDLPATPPLDVEELARRMGIESITESDMVEDGRLEQNIKSARIFLRSDLSEARRRFTIAHELGHRLLLHPHAAAERHRRRRPSDNEERLCDDLAAAILLPAPWVRREYRDRPQVLSIVRGLAGQTGTSLSASLVRLCELVEWDRSLLRFQLYSGRWRLVAPAAVPLQLHRAIGTTPATSKRLEEVGGRTRSDTQATLPLKVALAEYEVPAELSIAKSVAIALVDLSAVPRWGSAGQLRASP